MSETKRRPLASWQKEDAKRLRELWDTKKPMSQQRFAEEFLSATQGAFFQYVDGRIPLNLDAAIKFAAGLNVRVSVISPTLASRLRAAVEPEEDTLLPLSSDERALLERYRIAEPRWKLSIRLLSTIGTETQDEVAESVNMVIAKIFAMPTNAIRPVSNEKVRAAFGDAPHVAARKALREKK